jgi:hypothetical protein
MIQAAHIGVGISGVEVREPSRSLANSWLTESLVLPGLASREISWCGDFPIPVPEKAVIGPWFLELSATV